MNIVKKEGGILFKDRVLFDLTRIPCNYSGK
jgi:hypothetical protein